ncbi:MAG: FecR/PupR family sigma factor regulator, partial [Luteimonas sp.]
MADSSNDDDDRFEQAARWHLRLRDDGAPALLREYDAWLAADPRRASAMAEAEALLGALRRP